MARYADTVKNHAVWTTADKVKQALEGEFPRTEPVRDVLARVRFLLGKIDDRGSGEKYHYTAGSLDQLNQQLTSLTNVLGQLAANEGHVPALHKEIDAALAKMTSWPSAKRPRWTQAIQDASEEHISQLEKQAARVQEAVAANETATQAKLDEITAKHEALTKQYEDLLTQVKESDNKANATIDELTERFDTAKSGWDEAAKSQRESLGEENAERRKQWTNDARAELETIQGIARDAGVVAEAVAEKQIAEHYRDYAEEQRTAANRWNYATVAFLVVLALVLAWALSSIETVTWHASILRFGVTLTVLAVAGYCGAQATGHRHEERKARRIQHGLSSVGAFMSTVDDERRNVVRSMVAAQLFEDDGHKDAGAEGNLATQTAQLLINTPSGTTRDKVAGELEASGAPGN